jgi:hypothetical protein
MRITTATSRPAPVRAPRTAPLGRVITGPGRPTAWRPPVRLLGWLELLRAGTPAVA